MKTAQKDETRAGYHVVRTEDIGLLETEVARYIAAGWTPVGGVQVMFETPGSSFATYYQSLWYRAAG